MLTPSAALAALSLLAAPALVPTAPAAPAPAETATSKVSVGVGQQTVFTVSGLTRIAVGDPSVADVTVQPNGEVLVTGRVTGHTTLILWKGSAREMREVEVTQRRGAEIEKQIRALVGMEDVKVDELNGKVVLQGTVPTQAEVDNLLTLLKGEADVVNLVKVEAEGRRLVVEQINAALLKAGLRNTHASQVGSRIFLEGQVEDETDLRRAELIANTIAGNTVETRP